MAAASARSSGMGGEPVVVSRLLVAFRYHPHRETMTSKTPKYDAATRAAKDSITDRC